VLGATREKWVADADDEDDFRVSVRAANKVCRSVLHCVARHCSVMQCVADGDDENDCRVSARAATEACCNVMQCVATCFNVLLILMRRILFLCAATKMCDMTYCFVGCDWLQI